MVDELRDRGIWCNDFFIEDFFGRDNISVSSLLNIIGSLEDGVTELMCHPGYATGQPRLPSGYLDERPGELATLLDQRVIDAVRERGVRLRRFGGPG